jgi:phosphoribosylformylglycinamidine synthase
MAQAVLNLAIGLASTDMAPVLHDISDGGLAVAVAEVCVRSGVGAAVEVDDWRQFFSEAPHRFIAAIHSENSGPIAAMADDAGVAARRIGDFTGKTITLRSDSTEGSAALAAAESAYFESIPSRMR